MPAVFPLPWLMVVVTTVAALAAGLAGCGGPAVTADVAEPADTVDAVDVAEPGDTADVAVPADAFDAVDVADTAELPAPPSSFLILTFNVGTTDNMDHAYDEDGYDNRLAEINAGHFGNNLAWERARQAVRDIVDEHRPDIVAFQELFFDPECDEICAELNGTPDHDAACDPETGVFACATWGGVDLSFLTVRHALGPDYEIACAPNHNDNCIGVRKGFGSLAVMPDATATAGAWIGGLDGMPPPSLCSKGSRVATGVVTVNNGPQIAVVDVHTVAGNNADCRVDQFYQVFVDRGDGKPATFGENNIVLGDMNIDPFLFNDESVDFWNDHVGSDKPFHYISSGDASGPMTHPATFSRLDHVISDTMTGSCVVLGITDGTDAPLSPTSTYFDHRPVLCTVDMP